MRLVFSCESGAMMVARGLLAAALAAACSTRPPEAPAPPQDPFLGLESRLGGRVGVFALDTETGRELAHREDERFALCSTFKWALAAAVLARVDRGEEKLDRRISYDSGALLEHAPITRVHAARGFMTTAELAAASVTVSDNTAANLLLSQLGGPGAVTAFLRARGDTVTRLDRDEPALNENLAGDPRDTTSPRAMATALRTVFSGGQLSAASRDRLLGWMRSSPTGRERLRAGLPATWVVADKTGTCNRGAVNDVALAWPPGRPPIVIAAYLSDSRRTLPELNRAHAEIGRVVAAEFSRR